jgi:hypothetical protein
MVQYLSEYPELMKNISATDLKACKHTVKRFSVIAEQKHQAHAVGMLWCVV